MNLAPSRFERLAQNMRLERELLRVDELLEGIPFVVFKGIFLSLRLHGDLSQRTSADNDILVREVDGVRVLERLARAGYVPALDGLNAEEALRHAGQVALRHGSDPARPSIDLHVRAFSRNFFLVDEDWLWSEGLRSVELFGRPFLTFDDGTAFCHLVAHYLQHLFEEERLPDLGLGVERLAVSVDAEGLARRIERTVGWPAVWFSTAMAGHSFARSEDVRARLFGTVLPALFRRLRIDRSPTALRGAWAVALAERRAWSESARRAFFPPSDELEARYGRGGRGRLLLRHAVHRWLAR